MPDKVWTDYVPEKKWVDYTPPPSSPSGGFGSGYTIPSLRDIGTTAAKSVVGLGDTVVGLADIGANLSPWGYLGGASPSSILKNYTGYDPEMTRDWFSSLESEERKKSMAERAQNKTALDTAGYYWRNPGEAVLDIEESVPSMLFGGAVGRGLGAVGKLSGVARGAIGESIVGAGQQAASIREEKGDFGVEDVAPAITTGTLTGLVTAGSGKLAKKWGLPDVDELMANPKASGTRKAGALIGGGLTEALMEEAPQSMQEQILLNAATGKPLMEGVGSAGVSGAVSGFAMGAGMPAIRGAGGPRAKPVPPPVTPPSPVTPPIQDEFIQPTNAMGEPESPGRTMTDDVRWNLQTQDARIKDYMNSLDMPSFDPGDPTADRMRGIDIAESIPQVDAGGQQIFPEFQRSELPPRDVPPIGPFPQPPANEVQQTLPLGERGPGTALENETLETLRTMLGREPTEEEYWNAVERQAGPGDVTGLVAPFKGQPGSPEFNEMAQSYDDQITTRSGQESREMLREMFPPRQMDPANQIPVRIPGRDGAAEWPPRSGNVVQPVENPVSEQPNLPGIPVPVENQGIPVADMRARERDRQEMLPLSSDLPTDEMSPEEINRLLAEADELDARASQPQVELIDPESQGIRNNASGESSASWEAMSRQRSMQQRGEQYVIVDRAGNVTPLITTDAVDVPPPPGSTKGIITRDGQFRLLDGQGRPPKPEEVQRIASSMQPVQGEILPAEPQQTEFERMFGLEPGQEMTDEDIESFKRAWQGRERALYGGVDLVEDQAREDEATGTIGDPKNLYGEMGELEESPEKNITPEEDFGPESQVQQPDEVKMEIGDRVSILRNMQGQYADNGARVAVKELLQNALDETADNGNIEVSINYHGKPGLTVKDNGPGIPFDVLTNEYITLTGSGKRGVAQHHTGRKTIGEMGVGKATYLLGTEGFKVVTRTREADGLVWEYVLEGTPDQMIGEDTDGNPVPPVKIQKYRAVGASTGTEVTIYESDKDNLDKAAGYLETFAKYSDSPANIKISGNKYQAHPSWNLNLNVTPRTTGVGKHVYSGSAPGGNFTITIPPDAIWADNKDSIMAVVTARGMFQGAEGIYLNGQGKLPSRVIVNIEPTVPASNGKLYPLTAPTRERMKLDFKNEVSKALDVHIMQAARQKTKQAYQDAYDIMIPGKDPQTGRPLSFITNNRGGRYTQQEVDAFNSNPRIQTIGDILRQMLEDMDRVLPTLHRVTNTIAYGFDLGNDNEGGVNLQNVSNSAENKILLNPFTLLNLANGSSRVAGQLFSHAMIHEFNHNYERSEGADFTWAFLKNDAEYGVDRRKDFADAIAQTLDDGKGGIAPDILKLAATHATARGRTDTTIDFVARARQGIFLKKSGQGTDASTGGTSGGTVAGIKNELRKLLSDDRGAIDVTGKGLTQQTARMIKDETGQIVIPSWKSIKNSTGIGMGQSKPTGPPAQYNAVHEVIMLPSGATTTLDLSAPLRQGLGLIHTPQYWKALAKMPLGLINSEFDKIDAQLRAKPIFQPRRLANGKLGPSIAEEAGLHLMSPASSTNQMNQRSQQIASKWIETGGNIPFLSKAYFHSIGYPIRATNRAFITFLNTLRANRFEHLMNKAQDMAVKGMLTGRTNMPGVMGSLGMNQNVSLQEAMEMDPYGNVQLAKEIADFVNTATGQGPLKTHALPFRQAEINLEKHASALSMIYFSPGLVASRVRMLNPNTYVMASPSMRKEYMKSALATAGAWITFATMLKLGGGDEAEVSLDPASADFGKVRIGDTRLDIAGGFQQFVVFFARSWYGGTSTSSTGSFRKFGEGYRAETWLSTAMRFQSNKMNPVAKFAYDLADADAYAPFHVYDRLAQMAVPLYIQDIMELVEEDPSLFPMAIPVLFGAGTQIYGKGESTSRLVEEENDWLVQGGGGIRSLMPWNWNAEEGEVTNLPWQDYEEE